jgi:hypothetical protein
MLKPNGNFKLSKSAKRLMASSPNKEKSSIIKKMMIDAELASALQPKRERVRREGNTE